jgi:hypothetical protein
MLTKYAPAIPARRTTPMSACVWRITALLCGASEKASADGGVLTVVRFMVAVDIEGLRKR